MVKRHIMELLIVAQTKTTTGLDVLESGVVAALLEFAKTQHDVRGTVFRGKRDKPVKRLSGFSIVIAVIFQGSE